MDSGGADGTDGTDGTDGSDGGGDTGSPTPSYDWSACPGAEAWSGEPDWPGSLEASAEAVYCSAWSEDRTLPEELAGKALLRVVEGSWAIPTALGDYPLSLPVCTLEGASTAGPAVDGVGSTTVTASSAGGTTYTSLNGSQPLLLDGAPYLLDHSLLLVGPEGSEPEALLVNGQLRDPASGAGLLFTMRSPEVESWETASVRFGACEDPSWTEDIHSFSFDGGEATLHLRLGDNVTATAPGAFTRATGSLDGTSFDLVSTFQLIYRPGHHHFERHFAILFDSPIGEACGLLFEDVDPYAETPTAQLSTAACDLSPLSPRTVTAQSATIGE